MKKLMLLGGSQYLFPVIKTAHDLGIYVITCDYLPDNIAHKYSDEYCNVSVVDQNAVLEKAKELKIDGIMSFACDPGVTTAAYVAEHMSLAFQCSYESTVILQDKGKFREFLNKHGFNCPRAKRYTDKKTPFNDVDFFDWPVIVKPVDSAGSKGVTKIDSVSELDAAMDLALSKSRCGAFIIEEFLTFEGFHSSADPFVVEGEIKFNTYSDQLFDAEAENPYTPAMIIWPTTMQKTCQDILSSEIQRLMDLLHIRTGIFNIETCVSRDGKPYIMEVSPRGGGCRIAELQEMAYGTILIENEVRKAVNLPLKEIAKEKNINNHWCEMVIHAHDGQNGKLKDVNVDKQIKDKYVEMLAVSAKRGDIVKAFTGSDMALGDIFLKFESRSELDDVMSRSQEWLSIELES